MSQFHCPMYILCRKMEIYSSNSLQSQFLEGKNQNRLTLHIVILDNVRIQILKIVQVVVIQGNYKIFPLITRWQLVIPNQAIYVTTGCQLKPGVAIHVLGTCHTNLDTRDYLDYLGGCCLAPMKQANQTHAHTLTT